MALGSDSCSISCRCILVTAVLLALPLLVSSFSASPQNPSINRRSPQVSTTTTKVFMSSSPADMPSKQELEEVLKVAIDASKKAGEIIIGNAGGAEVTKTKANSKDLLTLIDPLCEKTIRETVQATFPTHDFLGEEDVPPGKEASAAALDAILAKSNDWLWIVDPSESMFIYCICSGIVCCQAYFNIIASEKTFVEYSALKSVVLIL